MKLKILHTLILLLLPFSVTFAQSWIKTEALPSVAYNVPPTVNIRLKAALKTDASGNVWVVFTGRKLGSYSPISEIGLARYDGQSWVRYDSINSPLPTNYLTDIDFEGSALWIATRKGLMKKDGNTWTSFNRSNSPLACDSVNDLLVHNNKLWVATDNGVTRISGNSFVSYDQSDGLASNTVWCIEALGEDQLCFGTDKGLSILNTTTNQWSTYTIQNSRMKSNHIYALQTDSRGRLWIGTDAVEMSYDDYYCPVVIYEQGDFHFLEEEPFVCSVPGRAYPRAVYDFARAGDKIVFDGSAASTNVPPSNLFLFYYQPGRLWKISPIVKGLTSNGILLDFDYKGRLWFTGRDGMQGDSLYCLTPGLYKDTFSKAGEPIAYLDVNKVAAPILSKGDMFWDLVSGAGYEVPKGNCRKAVFVSSLWMGGLVNNDLRIAAQTYRQNGSDYWEGPLAPGGGYTDATVVNRHKQLWKISRYDLAEFNRQFAAGKVQDGTYPIPPAIANWPAMGDTLRGFDKLIAPFVDRDNDKRYNPLKGDHPVMRGDQTVYSIFNDNVFHGESGSQPLGIEARVSAYAYACDQLNDNDSNSAINYTTFFHYDLLNRSVNRIDSFTIGLWVDGDIGAYSDDYVGCNPKEEYGYSYNGDNTDGGLHGYGTTPPAVGVVVLKGLNDVTTRQTKGMSGFSYYENSTTVSGNPRYASDFWNYLNQRWRDGMPVTYGGTGRGGVDPARFMYPGNDDPNGRPEWTEATAGNAPGDRRFLVTVGPVTLPVDSTTSVDFAIVFSQATSGGALASVAKLKNEVIKVKSWFNGQNFPTCYNDAKVGIGQVSSHAGSWKLYPNPGKENIYVLGENDRVLAPASYELFDITGKTLSKGKLSGDGSINVNALQDGVYLVKVIQGEQSNTFRLFKQQ